MNEIVVVDMESSDGTTEIASELADVVVPYPMLPGRNFDAARNAGAMYASYRHVLVVDCDERPPHALMDRLREMAEHHGSEFEGVLLPFRHFFAGHFLQCLYPGYTAPRFFRNGAFVFQPRLHSGVQVDGRTTMFPADNPDLAIQHFSFPSVEHYLTKMNGYTTGEAGNMQRDGREFHWQSAVAHFVEDMRGYYDHGRAWQDGPHGFLYSFFSGFYRFAQHAKLFEQRFKDGKLVQGEQGVPQSVEQMLEFALAVARQKPQAQASPIRVEGSAEEAHTKTRSHEERQAAHGNVVWSGPLRDPSGYGEDSRNLLLGLHENGVDAAGHALRWSNDVAELPSMEADQLAKWIDRPVFPGFTQISQDFANRFQRHPQSGRAIARTMFETDRLPADWVDGCNRMDSVWVPSEFNRQSFLDAGVANEKLVVVPCCLDAQEFEQPVEATPLVERLRSGCDFLFLTVFDWTLHKGWDVLLKGFLQSFPAGSGVRLALKVWSTNGYSTDEIYRQACELVRSTLGICLEGDPRVEFVFERLNRRELLALYHGCDAFVLPSRGEGWGRPYMEAMACGKPTIGTNWSGNTAFMTPENSFLIDCRITPVSEAGWREIPTYKGHRWAEPDLDSLRSQMLRVVNACEEAKAIGARARTEILEKYNRRSVGALMAAELLGSKTEGGQKAEGSRKKVSTRKDRQRNGSEPSAKRTEPLAVRWEGAFFAWHSLAYVNRKMASGLMERGVELATVPVEPNRFDPARFPSLRSLSGRAFAPLSQSADVHVRHQFPPRFERPSEGKLVLIQPWEYGYLPKQWIDPILANVDEVWCYSEYVRQVYERSGIPKERLQVVPLGVDAEVFRPDAPPYIFTDEPGVRADRTPTASLGEKGTDRFVFLFVGGTLHRKGIDILLEAYQKAFSAYDDVCLVIKDTGTTTVYAGQNERERILAFANDSSRPAIHYLDADLTEAQLAGVYTASDCVVLPYRGEGFCLPALEAIACGTPVIVPEGGPTDDFVDEAVGWRLPSERKPFGNGRIGEWECCGETWQFEVDPHDLGKQMRQVFQDRKEAQRRGEEGRKRVVESWTWRHSCDRAISRIEALRESGTRLPGMRRTEAALNPELGSRAAAGSHRPGSHLRRVEPSLSDRRTSARAVVAARRKIPKLSLCMIGKNEERVLDACLTSIKPFVDEIVFVDTGSTDRTVEIAKRHEVKLHHFPWCDDFAAARNVSIEPATGDWILWMDCDDTIPESCGKRLHDVILTAETDVSGFLMQVHIPPAPGENGFTVVDHVKLFRNLPGHRFERRIHEQILEPIYRTGREMEREVRIERSDLYVVHSGYDYSPEGQKHKRERDLRILALELQERGDEVFTLFNLGMTFHHLKRFDEAVQALERSLSLSKPHESTVRKTYAMLASCHLDMNDPTKARERVEQGLVLTPHDPELLFRAGAIYRVLGDLAAAERSYLHLLNARERGHIDSIDVSLTTYKAHHNLALIYQDQQRWPEAETQWRAAINGNPQFLPSWQGLAELFLRLRRFEDARGVASHIAPWAGREHVQPSSSSI